MTSFLTPTRSKLTGTLLGLLTLPGMLLLRALPVEWDLLDLRDLGNLVLGVLLGVPIQIFDAVTGSAFAARTEGFLGFPSLPELGFALCANVLFFYLSSTCSPVVAPAGTGLGQIDSKRSHPRPGADLRE